MFRDDWGKHTEAGPQTNPAGVSTGGRTPEPTAHRSSERFTRALALRTNQLVSDHKRGQFGGQVGVDVHVEQGAVGGVLL